MKDQLQQKVPESLVHHHWTEAMTTPALDTPSMDDPPPSWVDKDRFRRGQALYWKHFAQMSLSFFIGSAFSFRIKTVAKTLYLTGKFESVSRCYQRIVDTYKYAVPWLKGDLWNPEDEAYRGMATVQKMHHKIGRIANMNVEKTWAGKPQVSSEPGVYGECVLWEAIREDAQGVQGVPEFSFPPDQMFMSQFDSMSVVLGFLTCIMAYPEKIGLHGPSREDLEDFLHTWRVLSYYLGVQDKFNPCSKGLDEFREHVQHYRAAFVVPSLREMSKEDEYVPRLHYEALTVIAPFTRYLVPADTTVLYGSWLFDMDQTHVMKRVSLWGKVMFLLLKFFLFLMRLSFVRILVNYAAQKIVGKHFK